MVLAAPLDRQIAQARHANTARPPSLNCGFDEMWGQEGESDRPIDLSGAISAQAVSNGGLRGTRLAEFRAQSLAEKILVLAPRADLIE